MGNGGNEGAVWGMEVMEVQKGEWTCSMGNEGAVWGMEVMKVQYGEWR